MSQWVLFDYGVGNLHSLRKALQAAGADARITADPQELIDADVAVLPGVGAFGHVMESLRPAAQGLRDRHAAGRPILGVCIGMQALYEGSEESPGVPGLGIVPGMVKRLSNDAGKVPHMGWNTIHGIDDAQLMHLEGQHVYYVHSYAAQPDGNTIGTTTYGEPFAAGLRSGNTVAFQFHPEKSSSVGQEMLARTVTVLEETL